MAWNDPKPLYATTGLAHAPMGVQDTSYAKEVRKPTAAEYTEKRVAEAANILSNELDRLEGQYNRLRSHFGIPPEPCSPEAKGLCGNDGGMEGQLNRLSAQLSGLTGLVTKMNELI